MAAIRYENVKTLSGVCGETIAAGSAGMVLIFNGSGKLIRSDVVTEAPVGILCDDGALSDGDDITFVDVAGGGFCDVQVTDDVAVGELAVLTTDDGRINGVATGATALGAVSSIGVITDLYGRTATADGNLVRVKLQLNQAHA